MINTTSFLLSIIIPSYNMEEYIGNNLKRLVATQHLDKIEIIVVNDGSKDNTSAIAHEYQQQFPQNIIVVDKENAHYGSCINKGLALARGKYFRILDADDFFEPDALDAFVEKLETCDADLVVTLRTEITIDKNGKEKIKKFPIANIEYGKVYEASSFVITDYSKKVEFNMHSMTYKSSILHKVGLVLPTGICYTDLLYCLIPLSSIKDLIIYDIYLYNYLVGREGNSTNAIALKKNFSHITKVLTLMFEYLDAQKQECLTPAIRLNQLRYIDEAAILFMQSLRFNKHIKKEDYSNITVVMNYCRKYGIKNKYMKKYYFRIWQLFNTRFSLNCMLGWYAFAHPFRKI